MRRPPPAPRPDSGAAGQGDVPPWRYAAPAPRPPARAPRERRLLLAALAVALLAAVGGGLPRLDLALAEPVALGSGAVVPAWTADAAYVHPGAPVTAPRAGRLQALAPAGVVGAGAPLAVVAPDPAAAPHPELPAWARWDVGAAADASGQALLGLVPRPALAAALCLRPSCRSGGAEPPAAVLVRAPAAGWFSPGWDPLSGLSLPAMGDVPPEAVAARPVPLRPGTAVAAGTTLGALGDPWTGVWLVPLPAAARPALAASPDAQLSWAGGGPLRVRLVGTGPTVGGRFLALLAADGGGPQPGPPPRAAVALSLAPAAGQIVPTSALRPGGTVLALARRGRPAPLAVRVLAVGPRRAAVAGIPAGDRVLARPGLYWRQPPGGGMRTGGP